MYPDTDEERAAWWWLFRFYGEHEAVKLMRRWNHHADQQKFLSDTTTSDH